MPSYGSTFSFSHLVSSKLRSTAKKRPRYTIKFLYAATKERTQLERLEYRPIVIDLKTVKEKIVSLESSAATLKVDFFSVPDSQFICRTHTGKLTFYPD